MAMGSFVVSRPKAPVSEDLGGWKDSETSTYSLEAWHHVPIS